MSYSRLLMSATALTLGVLGVAASFAPDEIVRALGLPPARLADLLVQIIPGRGRDRVSGEGILLEPLPANQLNRAAAV